MTESVAVMHMRFPGFRIEETAKGDVILRGNGSSLVVPKLEIKNLIRFLEACDGAAK